MIGYMRRYEVWFITYIHAGDRQWWRRRRRRDVCSAQLGFYYCWRHCTALRIRFNGLYEWRCVGVAGADATEAALPAPVSAFRSACLQCVGDWGSSPAVTTEVDDLPLAVGPSTVGTSPSSSSLLGLSCGRSARCEAKNIGPADDSAPPVWLCVLLRLLPLDMNDGFDESDIR
eukprot:scpid56227/ scgid5694/ 